VQLHTVLGLSGKKKTKKSLQFYQQSTIINT
jgi:hypothetical protein